MSVVVSTNQKGLLFARQARAIAIAKGDALNAAAFAAGQGPGWREVELALKGTVNPMTTTSGGTALVATPVAIDFAEALRPATLLGKMMSQVRRVPFSTRMISVASGLIAHWRGEGGPVGVGKIDLDATTLLTTRSIDSIAVMTMELLRSSAPGIDGIVSADLIRACAYTADLALLDPVGAGSSSTPASITFGANSFESTGSTVAAIDHDLRAAIGAVTDADLDLASAFWLMSPRVATYLATVRGSGGAPAYPMMGARGGSLLGIPALTSTAAPKDHDSPAEDLITLIVASELAVADDQVATVEMSTEAALQLDSTPSTGAQATVSLWQNNLAALKVSRVLNWHLRRDDAVSVIVGCNYQG